MVSDDDNADDDDVVLTITTDQFKLDAGLTYWFNNWFNYWFKSTWSKVLVQKY